ncbi:MAG TPA: hypothetical protein VK892_03100, partial [Pyrinomonadaceae bacterium]|nr:hypothetical protein [Pyrinomonadaceae bacterium]
MDNFNQQTDAQARQKAFEAYGAENVQRFQSGRRTEERGRTAVWQARLVLLVMINIAQLWVLSATVEAALAGHYSKLLPLVISS